MIPGKWEAYEAKKLEENFKKMNPTEDSSMAHAIPRVFKEIKKLADFNEVCKSHRSCAIGILPAMTISDTEREDFEQKVDLLEALDK